MRSVSVGKKAHATRNGNCDVAKFKFEMHEPLTDLKISKRSFISTVFFTAKEKLIQLFEFSVPFCTNRAPESVD